MNSLDYSTASERTEKKFPDGFVLTSANQIILSYLSDDLISIGAAFDHMKKHLIYDADCELSPPQSEFSPVDKGLTQRKMELLHHAIGKVTEAVECYEAVHAHVLKGEELDEVNVLEEIFDGHWYDAGLVRLLGYSFRKGWAANIAKLRKRFPDKFNESDAAVRNLTEERSILEKSVYSNNSEGLLTAYNKLCQLFVLCDSSDPTKVTLDTKLYEQASEIIERSEDL